MDEKGRLKLPSDYQDYFRKIKETKVFVTTFDRRIARIYPVPLWKKAAEQLSQPGDDARLGDALLFRAKALGGTAEMDSQGRVLFPTELRRMLKLENEQVYLEHYRGHVNVFNHDVYDERMMLADQTPDALERFEKRGLL